ncbi:MAG: MarR family transcriptional regulator [Phycisphaerales bacterium]
MRTLRKTDTATGISPARLSALSVLVFGGPRSLRELAEAEQVTAPTMSRIVAGLESDGYVTRRPDRHDQRAIQLRSTAKGKAALERARRLRIESLASLLRSASKDDLATLSQAARLIAEAVAAQ